MSAPEQDLDTWEAAWLDSLDALDAAERAAVTAEREASGLSESAYRGAVEAEFADLIGRAFDAPLNATDAEQAARDEAVRQLEASTYGRSAAYELADARDFALPDAEWDYWKHRLTLERYAELHDGTELDPAFVAEHERLRDVALRLVLGLPEPHFAPTATAPPADLGSTLTDAPIDEAAVIREVERLRVRDEAARRHRAASAPTVGRVLDWAELEDYADRPWLVPGMLAIGTTAEIVSKRNIGKSLLAFALAGCVATGTDFLGRPVEQGRVVIVLGEGARGFSRRMDAWATANGHDMALIRDRVRVVGEGVNLSSDASLAELRRIIREASPTLIILDTWASLSGIDVEYDQSETQRVLNDVKLLGGDAVKLILHHPNAETEDTTAPKSRGGSALPSGVDTVLTLWHDRSHSDPSRPGAAFLALSTEEEHAGKQKEAERETIRGLHIADSEAGPYMAHFAVLSTAERWAIEHMRFGEPVTLADLEASSGTPRSTIQRHLNRAPGFVVKEAGIPGSAARYTRTK